jgi:serine/threonine protein phosphatase PrpC
MPVRIKPYKIVASGLSDVGLIRKNNEDVWGGVDAHHFYALADGMGGHAAGEVAAHEAIQTLCQQISDELEQRDEELTLDEARHLVGEAIERVNTHVYRLGRKNTDLRGMGTTLCCLLFQPRGLVYAHVGDSRIYRLRKGHLFQMTKDHSLVRELVETGKLEERQAGEYLYRNIITKAVGTEPYLEPTVRVCDLLPDDIFLMCTDGLSDHVSRDEMEGLLKAPLPLADIAQSLLAAAKEKGGHDNITLVVVHVKKEQK